MNSMKGSIKFPHAAEWRSPARKYRGVPWGCGISIAEGVERWPVLEARHWKIGDRDNTSEISLKS